MENPVLIFGAGDLGLKALDIFKKNNVMVYGFLDDRPELQGKEFGDVSVLGEKGWLKLSPRITNRCLLMPSMNRR